MMIEEKRDELDIAFWMAFGRALIEEVHHCIVILDDLFCHWFSLSRKARGKWLVGQNTEKQRD